MIGRFLRYLIPLAALGYALMLGFSALFGEGALMIGAIVAVAVLAALLVCVLERLKELDKYTVYLGGNQPLVRIHNPEGEGRILVIRDSYANCLGTFLAQSYAEVVLVDLRYYKSPVSELAKEGFDQVLVCYSLYNFLTDANFPWLK